MKPELPVRDMKLATLRNSLDRSTKRKGDSERDRIEYENIEAR